MNKCNWALSKERRAVAEKEIASIGSYDMKKVSSVSADEFRYLVLQDHR